MKLFASKRATGFRHLYKSKINLQVAGEYNPVQVDVAELNTPEAGCYFAWKTGPDTFSHIYPDLRLLHMCSPDAFQSAIERGEGTICPVSVTEVNLSDNLQPGI